MTSMLRRTRAILICVILIAQAGGAWGKDKPQLAPGAHKLAVVVRTATRTETGGARDVVERLRAEGLADAEILRDGSVAAGIVYCCGGSITKETMVYAYVPPEFTLAPGDVVEVVLGRPANRRKKDPGSLNRVVARHESFEDEQGACRWVPENETLWMRVLHCDWMEEQGWVFADGLDKAWYKPAP